MMSELPQLPPITPAPLVVERADGSAMTTGFTEIPDELKSAPRWVVWRYEERNGKPTKVPYDARRGSRAASDDPQTWSTFGEAVRAVEGGGYAGIGFMLGDGWTGIDLDKCRNAETAVIEDWATDIINSVDSYTEVSPSGKGVHMLVMARLPKGRRRTGRIEMDDALRYFTITGQIVGERRTLQERQDQVEALHARIFKHGSDTSLTMVPRGDRGSVAGPHRQDQRLSSGLFVLDPNANPPFEKFDLLCEIEPKFRASWDHKRADFDDQSCSVYDQSLANFAALTRWPDQEIANLLIAHRRKHGADLKLRADYFERTIRTARQAAEPTILDQRIMELVQDDASGSRPASNSSDTHNDSETSPDAHVAAESGGGGERKRTILKTLSARFKVEDTVTFA